MQKVRHLATASMVSATTSRKPSARRAPRTDGSEEVISGVVSAQMAQAAENVAEPSEALAKAAERSLAFAAIAEQDPAQNTGRARVVFSSERLAAKATPTGLVAMLGRAPQLNMRLVDTEKMNALFAESDVARLTKASMAASASGEAGPGNINPVTARKPIFRGGDPVPLEMRRIDDEMVRDRWRATIAEADTTVDLERAVDAETRLMQGGPLDEGAIASLLAPGYLPTTAGSDAATSMLLLQLLRASAKNNPIDTYIPLEDVGRREMHLSKLEKRTRADETAYCREPIKVLGEPPCVNDLQCQGVVMECMGGEGFTLVSYKKRPKERCVLCERYRANLIIFNLLCDNTVLPPNLQGAEYYNVVGEQGEYCCEDTLYPAPGAGYMGMVDPVVMHKDMGRIEVVQTQYGPIRYITQPFLQYSSPDEPVGGAAGNF